MKKLATAAAALALTLAACSAGPDDSLGDAKGAVDTSDVNVKTFPDRYPNIAWYVIPDTCIVVIGEAGEKTTIMQDYVCLAERDALPPAAAIPR